jgi:hypothetical protein
MSPVAGAFVAGARCAERDTSMAPKAGKIQQRVRSATFEIEGDDWEIQFKPFSSDTLRAALQGDEAEQYDGICKLLAQTVVSWNLEGDDGEPLPIAPDKYVPLAAEGEEAILEVSPGMAWLRSVGLDYVQAILNGILEEIRVGKLSGADSSGGLRRVV